MNDYIHPSSYWLDVAIIDIDKFKNTNDAYGRATDDAVIVNLANTLKVVSDKLGMFLGWLGGEEFVVFSQQSMGSEFLPTCELLRTKVEAIIVNFGAIKVNYTIWVGVAHGSINESFQRFNIERI